MGHHRTSTSPNPHGWDLRWAFLSRLCEGSIVFLPKLGDFWLLNNKWPITLLNSMFKICSKHYQLLLAKVCIDFISLYQFAFIPRQTIHYALLLTLEVLHKAKLAMEDFIFLKLDIRKAFDSLEWGFLFVALENFGFGPTFINYIRATIMGPTSTILLNGRFTNPFPISHSIR